MKSKGSSLAGSFTAVVILSALPAARDPNGLWKKAEKLGIQLTSNAVDIGVRVEMPAEVLESITDVIYESKLVYFSRSFDDRVRTFCMNPYGFVVEENNDGLLTVKRP